MTLTRRSAFGLAALLFVATPLRVATSGAPPKVLTAIPAAAALARALLDGTGAEVIAVQPDRLPASRLQSFLAGRGADALAAAAPNGDAVLGLRSLWPGDPLWPHARRTNLRITEIDMATPLDGALPGIARRDPTRNDPVYAELDLTPMHALEVEMSPWLAPSALSHMAAITAADFQRLYPTGADRIGANRDALAAGLRDQRARAERGLLAAPDLSCLSLTPAASYIAPDLGIEVLAEVIAAPREWSPERSALLAEWLRRNAVGVVLTDEAVEGDLAKAIADAGARVVTLQSVGGSDNNPVQAVAASIERIIGGFAG